MEKRTLPSGADAAASNSPEAGVTGIADGFEVRSLLPEDADSFFRSHHAELFGDEVEYRFWTRLAPDSLEALGRLDSAIETPRAFAWGAWSGGALVGASLAAQEHGANLHVRLSGVLPAWRRRGLYARLLEAAVATARAEGFQTVSSAHNAANNAVLVPKLKAGFLIAGFEIGDVQGLRVRLVRYLVQERAEVHEFRAGFKPLPEPARSAFAAFTVPRDGSPPRDGEKESTPTSSSR